MTSSAADTRGSANAHAVRATTTMSRLPLLMHAPAGGNPASSAPTARTCVAAVFPVAILTSAAASAHIDAMAMRQNVARHVWPGSLAAGLSSASALGG